MINIRRTASAALFFAVIAPGAAIAQRPGPDSARPRRQMLEQRLRERTAEVVKRRLQLSDDQMKQLQATNQRYEKQRADLMARERDTRRELRQQLLAGDDANQNRVGQLLDQAMQIERQRLDLQQSEQRDLAKFLKPVQRAKLFGLQAEMRRRVQQMRSGAGQRRGMMPPGPGGPKRGFVPPPPATNKQ